nr:ABC transporter substrate-binding protein [Bradyrhizobium centrolobii]
MPAENILPGEGRGLEIAQGRLGPGPHPTLHAADRLGPARAGIDVPARGQGSVREDIANSFCEIAQARLLTLQTADKMDREGNKVDRRGQYCDARMAARRMRGERVWQADSPRGLMIGGEPSNRRSKNMRRRAFLQASGSAVITWPMRAWAKKDTKLLLVAVLFPSTEELFNPRVAALRGGLKDEGMVEGRDYLLETRVASGDFSQLPRLTQELDARQPEVFVAAATAAAVVHSVLPDRPLVFTGMAVDPIAVGLAESYRKPGGTATGNVINAVGGEDSLAEKRVGFFKDLVPNIERLGMIGVVWDPQVLQGVLSHQEETALQKVSVQLGFRFENYAVKTHEDIEGVFAKALSDGVDALYISGDPLLTSNMSRVMPHILAAGKPTLGVYPEWGRAGLLLTYSTDALDGYRRAGAYAAKIVRGVKPADLPIEQASKFWLVVNLKTAKQLGISVPPNLLVVADEVID